MTTLHLAIDLGAGSGRVIAGRLAASGIDLEEIHRFPHEPREQNGRMRWDYSALLEGVRTGLRRACEKAGSEPVRSVSCDAWAQDFGLLDGHGRLFYAPVSYRDERTRDIPQRLEQAMPWQALQRRNGSALSPITTLCQLKAMAEQEPDALSGRPLLLHMADLVHYELCGVAATDWTLATASQLWNIAAGTWDRALLRDLGIPALRLPAVRRRPGALGRMSPERAPHPRLAGVPVVSAAGHDTAAAAAVLYPGPPGTLFLSLGTWGMLGCLLGEDPGIARFPEDRDAAYLGLPLEQWGLFRGGAGLWPIQQCRARWRQSGQDLDWPALARAAEESAYEGSIDPGHESLFAPDDMPEALRTLCRASGQPVPDTPGDVARLVYRSLARAQAREIARLETFTGFRFTELPLVSGGVRNRLLCDMLADESGRPIRRGPAEATAAGNILLQGIATDVLAPGGQPLGQLTGTLFA